MIWLLQIWVVNDLLLHQGPSHKTLHITILAQVCGIPTPTRPFHYKLRPQEVCECVYKIPCRNSNQTNIGDQYWRDKYSVWSPTTGTLPHRQEVSQRDVRAYTRSTSRSLATKQSKSAVTDHAITLNHVIKWDQAKAVDRKTIKQICGSKKRYVSEKNKTSRWTKMSVQFSYI